jgi:EAL domain-containing protein (putative c-di-GMP-specific phosphodiesterase class I)
VHRTVSSSWARRRSTFARVKFLSRLFTALTVEGVETKQQVAFLDGADADQVQGFFFGRPVPASEISAVIFKNFQRLLPTQPSGSSNEARQRVFRLAVER